MFCFHSTPTISISLFLPLLVFQLSKPPNLAVPFILFIFYLFLSNNVFLFSLFYCVKVQIVCLPRIHTLKLILQVGYNFEVIVSTLYNSG